MVESGPYAVPVRLLLGGVLAVLLAGPFAAAVAEDNDLIVQLEVSLPAQDRELVDPSAFPVRVEPGETVELTVLVFDPGDSNTPVGVEDTSELVELRDTADSNPPLRFADMSEGPQGVYTTTHTFNEEGEFLMVVQPAVEDRTTLHPESTDQVRFVVGGDVPPPPDDGSNLMGILVPVLLVLMVAVLVIVATRRRPGRRYEKKAPGRAEADKDTWWWSG
jgi:hypothetical protein